MILPLEWAKRSQMSYRLIQQVNKHGSLWISLFLLFNLYEENVHNRKKKSTKPKFIFVSVMNATLFMLWIMNRTSSGLDCTAAHQSLSNGPHRQTMYQSSACLTWTRAVTFNDVLATDTCNTDGGHVFFLSFFLVAMIESQ